MEQAAGEANCLAVCSRSQSLSLIWQHHLLTSWSPMLQVERAAGEVDFYSHQLAHLHGQRDRALVEMTRLEEVAPLARRESGVNKRMVSTPDKDPCWTLTLLDPDPA